MKGSEKSCISPPKNRGQDHGLVVPALFCYSNGEGDRQLREDEKQTRKGREKREEKKYSEYDGSCKSYFESSLMPSNQMCFFSCSHFLQFFNMCVVLHRFWRERTLTCMDIFEFQA